MKKKTSERASISYNDYVLKTTNKAALYNGLFMLGVGLVFSAGILIGASWAISQVDALVITFAAICATIGLFLTGYGYGGTRWLTDQVVEFPTQLRVEEEETPDNAPTQPQQEFIPTNRGSVAKTRPERILYTKDGETAVFSGRNIDKLMLWHQSGNVTIKRDGDQYSFRVLPDPITSSRYTIARRALVDNGLVDDGTSEWADKGIDWLYDVHQ